VWLAAGADFRDLLFRNRFPPFFWDATMSFKVLVADDSGVMRKILIRSLNACSVTDIVEANDGAEAIARFGEQHFDLVLTDWNMPNKTGLEVLQSIRAGGSTVPVIMITTEAESSRVKEAISAGVTDYLAKPFENDALRAKLDKLVCV
jgi:two-component system, chemotaxis family, chemotaxis protein CheY